MNRRGERTVPMHKKVSVFALAVNYIPAGIAGNRKRYEYRVEVRRKGRLLCRDYRHTDGASAFWWETYPVRSVTVRPADGVFLVRC